MKIQHNLTSSLYLLALLITGSWESVRADFIRRQGTDFMSPTPYTETAGVKHTPYITFDEAGGLISVGGGDTIHPMTASSDASVVHFVTEVLVEDQDGKIIFMKALDPTNVDSVSDVVFAIPEETTSVTAYEFCNLHGESLFVCDVFMYFMSFSSKI